MDSLNSLLQRKKFEKNSSSRPVNEKWERAKLIASQIGVTPPFVLKLQKLFGTAKVESALSYLRDYPYIGKLDVKGKPLTPYRIFYWRLKKLSGFDT